MIFINPFIKNFKQEKELKIKELRRQLVDAIGKDQNLFEKLLDLLVDHKIFVAKDSAEIKKLKSKL